VVLDCVREAESRIAGKANMEYLPTNGNKDFVRHSIKLAYGDDSKAVAANTVAAIQTLSGRAGCHFSHHVILVGRSAFTLVTASTVHVTDLTPGSECAPTLGHWILPPHGGGLYKL
jgi:aspartate/tyrosine/aromatic aminotransferase